MTRSSLANDASLSKCLGLLLCLLVASSNIAILAGTTVRSLDARLSEGHPTKAHRPDDGSRTEHASKIYGHVPLSFESNIGQTDSRVKFLARGNNYSVFLTPTEAVVVLAPLAATACPVESDLGGRPSLVHEVCRPSTVSGCVLKMRFVGANPAARAEGLNPLAVKSSYFVGNDPKKWRSGVPSYGKVRFSRIYPGVDETLYGNESQLEYDLVIAPRADISRLCLVFDGIDSLRIDDSGDLVIGTRGGEIRHHRPSAYQESGGLKRQVSARYVKKGDHQVGLVVDEYDKNSRLVIDPVLSYSTFLGGNRDDEGRSVVVDSLGNAYITGWTKSLNFPTTAGAYQATPGQYATVFVSKLNPEGSALIYSTYLGGSGGEEGHGIAVNAAGEAYITGSTASTDFPTTAGALQRTYGGSGDAFVTKLNASGTNLVYSTYVGGSGSEFPSAIALDSQGNAHITGMVTKGGFPVTAGAFQTTFRGGYENPVEWGDAYVCKLNPDGSGLVYATYLGGADGEIGTGIAIDREGFAYVSGDTSSKDFPVTPGAYQMNLANTFCPSRFANCANSFVTKFNLTGTALIYSTYVGGDNGEYNGGIAVDSSGDAFIAGSTFSSNFPTVNAFQTRFAGGVRDGYITEINAAGTAAIFSTYFGGSGLDDADGIALDQAGNVYIVGYTNSANLPIINAIQPVLAGSYDAFVAKLDPRTGTLVYCTYLGGSRDEGLGYAGIAVDAAANVYVTGVTRSSDFPTTVAAFQKAFGGGDYFGTPYSDAFVAKIRGAGSYDICLQDDVTGSLLQINATDGEYQFTSCDGFAVGGIGNVRKKPGKIILEHNATDRSIYAKVKTAANKATASVEMFSPARKFTIHDRNIADNTCRCQ